MKMKLTDAVIKCFKPAKEFQESDHINSLDFSIDGKHLVCGSDDNCIFSIRADIGQYNKSINSKKYGAKLVRFTQAKDTALHASTKIDDTIRYLQLDETKYIRYFKGHTDTVRSLCMNRNDDTFISAAKDNTVKLWDLRSNSCQGTISSQSPYVCYDPEGILFAVASHDPHQVKLYDLRHFDKGEFAAFTCTSFLEGGTTVPRWSDILFSPDGSLLVLPTYGSKLYVIDAFDGRLLKILNFNHGKRRSNCYYQVCLSPDGQFVLSGDDEGNVHVWHARPISSTGASLSKLSMRGYSKEMSSSSTNANAPNEDEVVILPPLHVDSSNRKRAPPSPITSIMWNPEFCTFATAGSKCTLWLPDLSPST